MDFRMLLTERFSGSSALALRARRLMPSGVSHDMRFAEPFPLYQARAKGARKWDVDGNELIDYWVGHGGLILGHCHSEVVEAICAAVRNGFHAGGCHSLEVEWAELVTRLVPSVESVRFTASGTEATMLAMRLARAATSRSRILKFEGHFHGWHDYACYGVNPPFESKQSTGVPEQLDATVTVVPPDLGLVDVELAKGDVAGVVIEPTGAAMGLVPIDKSFLEGLRHKCDQAKTVLVFDEVITAFRYSPGGVQELTGVLPDLTCLGKILGGGMPAGAVGGRRSIMGLLAFRGDPYADRFERVVHTGTTTSNPASAAAGVTTLRLIEDGEAGRKAALLGDALVSQLRDLIQRRGARWCVTGESSTFHWLPIAYEELASTQLGGHSMPVALARPNPGGTPTPSAGGQERGRLPSRADRLRHALWERGVDFPPFEGWLSAAHTPADIETTVAAFGEAIEVVPDDG